MENNILDELETEIKAPKFALKSFDQFWYSVTFYTVVPIIFELLKRSTLLNLTAISSRFGGLFFLGSLLFGMIGFVCNFLGMRNALKSIRQNENFTRKIWIGGFGNLVLFFLCITMATFYILKFLGDGRFY